MTSKLVGDVKMVGPTINCEGTATLESGERRNNPHVQSFAVATDAVGMELLVQDGKVFGCYDAFQETIYHSELGASAVILEAGYNLDSFMVRAAAQCRQQRPALRGRSLCLTPSTRVPLMQGAADPGPRRYQGG